MLDGNFSLVNGVSVNLSTSALAWRAGAPEVNMDRPNGYFYNVSDTPICVINVYKFILFLYVNSFHGLRR